MNWEEPKVLEKLPQPVRKTNLINSVNCSFDVGPERSHPVEVVSVEVERKDQRVKQLLQQEEDARLDSLEAPRETHLRGKGRYLSAADNSDNSNPFGGQLISLISN